MRMSNSGMILLTIVNMLYGITVYSFGMYLGYNIRKEEENKNE